MTARSVKLAPKVKLEMYRAGNYLMPPPPVCTRNWGEDNWIHFIDTYGRWDAKAQQRYLFRCISHLIDSGYRMQVYADGEPIEWEEHSHEAEILNAPAAIFNLTQMVDEGHLIMWEDGAEIGWIFFTNCNEEHESICDWTCGFRSTFDPILDKWMENQPEYYL